jgi:hypothetical protein
MAYGDRGMLRDGRVYLTLGATSTGAPRSAPMDAGVLFRTWDGPELPCTAPCGEPIATLPEQPPREEADAVPDGGSAASLRQFGIKVVVTRVHLGVCNRL